MTQKFFGQLSNTTTDVAADRESLIEIESTLRTRVIDIVRSNLSALAEESQASAYDKVMNEPDTLLHESFTLFRSKPALFAPLLIDNQGNAVPPSDESALSCGETVGHVITLVLRASARRYFRRELGGPTSVTLPPVKPSGLVRRMMEKMELAEKPAPRKQTAQGKGEELFLAMRELLRFDWQAQLIPAYTALTPEMVSELSDRLLDVREPSEVRALAVSTGRKPLILSTARRLIEVETGSIQSDLLWQLWEQMQVGRLFDHPERPAVKRILADIAATSKEAIYALMPVIGADIRHFVLFLFLAYRLFGRNGYKDAFCSDGESGWKIHVYVARLTALGTLPPPVFERMIEFYTPPLATPIDSQESRRSIYG